MLTSDDTTVPTSCQPDAATIANYLPVSFTQTPSCWAASDAPYRRPGPDQPAAGTAASR